MHRGHHRTATAWGPARWQIIRKHHSPLDTLKLSCGSSPHFVPGPEHFFWLNWIQTCSRIKINQYSGDTFQEISASGIGPVQPTALNFTPAPQVSKVHRSLCAFPGYKLKYSWCKSWPKFLCTSPIRGNPTALEIALYWTLELCRIHQRKLPGNATANFRSRKQALECHKTITEH